MKKVILLVALIISSISLPAQSFDWGPKINIGSPDVSVKDIKNLKNNDNNINDLLKVKDASINLQLGVYAMI